MRKAETVEEVTLQPSIVCDNFEMTKALSIAGAGIFRGVRQLLDAHFDEGELVPLFEGYKPVSDRIFYAVMPGRTEGPSRSKDLIDIATEVMRAYRAQRLNLRKAGRR